MTDIYKNARSVAVWLRTEARDSELATRLLKDVAAADEAGIDRGRFRDMVSLRPDALQSLSAVASLFSRDYWSRIWVVQEISNAADIHVYCGIHSQPLPWSVYLAASRTFHEHREDLEDFLPGPHSIASDSQYSCSQILAYQGPQSLPEVSGLGGEVPLDAMRKCRRKLSSDPRDKVFGVLGDLDRHVRGRVVVDYGKSVKDV